MLDREFQYFRDHQDELVKKYNGRYVVIVGERVISDHATVADAYEAALKEHAEGTFLIQLCIPGKEAYTQTFNSRAVFA